MSTFRPTRLTPFSRAAVPLLRQEGAYVSEKFDGWRLTWHPAEGVFRTRSGRVLETPLLASWKAQALALSPRFILDGELYNNQFHVFDVVMEGTFAQRYAWLKEAFALSTGKKSAQASREKSKSKSPETSREKSKSPERKSSTKDETKSTTQSPGLLLVEQIYFPPGTFSEKALRGAMALVLARGGEGVVARAADQQYQEGTSPSAFKLKPVETSEALVVAYYRTPAAEKTQSASYVSSLVCLTEEEVDFRLSVKRDRGLLPLPGSVVMVKHSGQVNGAPKFPSLDGVRSEKDLEPDSAETFRRLREKLQLDSPAWRDVPLPAAGKGKKGQGKSVTYSLSQAQVDLYSSNKNYAGLFRLARGAGAELALAGPALVGGSSSKRSQDRSQSRSKSRRSGKSRSASRDRKSGKSGKSGKIPLRPGQFAVVKSGENMYKVARPRDASLPPYCSCPHWLYQHLPAAMRECKHTKLVQEI